MSIAATLILENFAVPMNHTEIEMPLSRYSSSENVLNVDGSPNYVGSVAEKARMFELTASLNSPEKSNVKRSPISSPKQPSSPRKKLFSPKSNKPKENNENTPNIANGANDKGDSMFQDIANRSWADIMDSESDNFA